MADEGVGGLAYSGKIMKPVAWSSNVERLRDELFERTNMRYDCCLINWFFLCRIVSSHLLCLHLLCVPQQSVGCAPPSQVCRLVCVCRSADLWDFFLRV